MNEITFALARFFVNLYPFFRTVAIIVGSIFVVSGLMDFVFDIYFLFHSIRRYFLAKHWPKLTLERLEAREQQKVAIIIACWHEKVVIAKTLTNACKNIHYRNYDIFVGTYPNDPETQAEVDRVSREFPQVHKVITADNGPTNKAANLNQVFEAIQNYEHKTGLRYEIIIMHDAEDIVHPYELLVSNYLIPRMDVVQIPVFPMDLPLRHVTHWTYADEFAENHTKLLLVRELIGGFVPSAGVGTAFTKRAFELFAIENAKKIFTTDSLTEDYELGLRMNLRGYRGAFVLVRIPYEDGENQKGKKVIDWVATRAVFPLSFWSAVRQKTRWNIGIILQSWQKIGWKGNAMVRWNLFQDRKALFTTPTTFVGYFVLLYFFLYQILRTYFVIYMPPLIVPNTLLWYLTIISTFFMIWRLGSRAYAVNKIYGLWPAITSIPRSIWGNIINFFAIVRAFYIYLTTRIHKQTVQWDKTDHNLPSEVEVIEEKIANKNNTQPSNGNHIATKEFDEESLINDFNKIIETGTVKEKVEILKKINRQTAPILFPYMVKCAQDEAWQVRGEFCRTCSFLRYVQAIPYLRKLAGDKDWTVRSNAVRALGKLGDLGEKELLDILKGQDRYASDAAQAILEHQAFFKQNVRRLFSENQVEVKRGLTFLDDLKNYGRSKLAEEILNLYIEGNEEEIHIFLGE